MLKCDRILAPSGNLASFQASSRCRSIPISGACHGLPVLQPRPTCSAMCPRRLFQARGGRWRRPSRRLLSLAACLMIAWPVSCTNSRPSFSGAGLKAQDGRAGPSSTRPFGTLPVRWRALSHGRQDAQDAQRKHMLLRLQEPRRKAIRADLQAGVAPSQVARHFGLLLGAVRKVLTAAE